MSSEFSNESAKDELSKESLQSLAAGVCERGLEAPAVFFLESYKPMMTMFKEMVLFSAPISSFIFGSKNVSKLSEVLGSRETVEKLITEIEASSARNKSKGPK